MTSRRVSSRTTAWQRERHDVASCAFGRSWSGLYGSYRDNCQKHRYCLLFLTSVTLDKPFFTELTAQKKEAIKLSDAGGLEGLIYAVGW